MGKTLELGWVSGECPIVMSVLSAYDNMKYPRIGVRVSPNKSFWYRSVWEPEVQHLRLRRRFSALIKVNEERSTL